MARRRLVSVLRRIEPRNNPRTTSRQLQYSATFTKSTHRQREVLSKGVPLEA